jgi:lipoate-protein ligase A
MSREKVGSSLTTQGKIVEQTSLQIQHDEALLEEVQLGDPWRYRSWEPDHYAVVLGRGNSVSLEVYEERCHIDRIPILRRRGGGGTVLLAPGNLVISLAKQVQHQFQFKEYFWQINSYIIEALKRLGVQALSQHGHSDICIGERKILGSSMYRKKFLLFYTASLMISNDIHDIARYLKHPSKEPDYRQERSHAAFLTTISREYPQLDVKTVQAAVDEVFTQRIEEIQ